MRWKLRWWRRREKVSLSHTSPSHWRWRRGSLVLTSSCSKWMSPGYDAPPSSPSPAPTIIEWVIVPHIFHSPSSCYSRRRTPQRWPVRKIVRLRWQICLISVELLAVLLLPLWVISVSSSEPVIRLWSSSSRWWEIIHWTAPATPIHLPGPVGAISSSRHWSSTPPSPTWKSGIEPLIIHDLELCAAIRCCAKIGLDR